MNPTDPELNPLDAAQAENLVSSTYDKLIEAMSEEKAWLIYNYVDAKMAQFALRYGLVRKA